MLRCIRDEILDAAHNIVEEDVTVDKSAEAGNLASNGGSHLGLVVFEKLYESGNEIPRDNLLVNCLGDLQKVSTAQSNIGLTIRTFSNRSAIM